MPDAPGRRAADGRDDLRASSGSACRSPTRCCCATCPHGDGIVVDVLVGTFIGDTGAYLGGRALGRRPLSPRLSPNKTVEGLAIGIVAGVAGVWFAGLYQDWLSGTDALLLGLGRRARRPGRRPVRVGASSAARARRTPGGCSAPTAARWTASTR